MKVTLKFTTIENGKIKCDNVLAADLPSAMPCIKWLNDCFPAPTFLNPCVYAAEDLGHIKAGWPICIRTDVPVCA